MQKYLLSLIILCLFPFISKSQEKVLNIIAIGAHPDDCDIKFGGTAILFSRMGHNVKFLSIANGDAGHMEQGGGVLAQRRFEETQKAASKLGVIYEVLDYHDGEVIPTLELRMEIVRQIRDWDADIVISHRPYDYHPDHRYTSAVVQDAAFMVEVPNFVPGTPALRKTPLFLFFKDHFQTPYPFTPDIAIDITGVIDEKINAISSYESQFYEWLPWVSRYEVEIPKDNESRMQWLKNWIIGHPRWSPKVTPEILISLEKWYGRDEVKKIKYAEAFEICEFGRQPADEEIRMMFPMTGK